MKDFITLLGNIANQANKANKPVSVQTGIIEGSNEVRLDPQLTARLKVPEIFENGVKVHIEGTINGHEVSGNLTLTRKLEAGTKVKVIKEDGVDKYYLSDTIV